MNKMKTLTVNGKTYEICDPSAPRIDNTAVGDALWSSKRTVDRLCPAFNEQGAVVACRPVEGYPLEAVTQITPVQSGSGDPSPDNIRPITGHTGAKLWRGGKNLLENINGSGSHNGINYTVNEDGSITCTGTSTVNNSFKNVNVKGSTVCAIPPGDYIVSGGKDGVRVQVIVDSTELVTCSNNEVRFTVPETATNSWIRLSVPYAGTSVNTTVYPMIRPASVTDSNYEPYRGEEFTAQLGQTVYGGSYDWTSGVLTLERKTKTFDGTETIDLYGSASNNYFNYRFRYEDPSLGAQPYTTESLCSHFPHNIDVFADSKDGAGHLVNNQIIYIRLDPASTVTTVDAFKAFLAEQYAAGTPVQVCYKLATPVTVRLTPQEVLALSGANCLYSDTGDTAVTGRADPLVVMEKLTNAIISLGGNV